jgi:hypothetical protein
MAFLRWFLGFRQGVKNCAFEDIRRSLKQLPNTWLSVGLPHVQRLLEMRASQTQEWSSGGGYGSHLAAASSKP